MAQHFDLIVIGSGPAGRRAAVRVAKVKKSVLVVERGRRVGGVCVRTGTTPQRDQCIKWLFELEAPASPMSLVS